MLPKSTVARDPGKIVALPFKGVQIARRLGMIAPRGAQISAPGRRLLALVRERLTEN